MQTKIEQVSPVEYELEIQATAADLAPEFNKALRAQQAKAQLKGFRPGKVPTALVKKMYGKALAYEIAERTVQQTYEAQVHDSGDYKVLGAPQITKLDYDMDGDLVATVRFGVRPEVTFQDLSGETLPKLAHEAGEEEVNQTLERLRREHADLVPVDDAGAGDEDHLVVDMQQIDEASGAPIVGKNEEDTSFFLDDERLHDELRDALKGKKPGDVVQVDLPHGHGDHVHTHRYAVTVKEVKRRELPEIDDEFAREISNNRLETADALRAEILERLKMDWEKETREMLEGMMVSRLLELHPIPVPDAVIESFLDSFVEDVKQRNEKKLPDGFNEAAFRVQNRAEAERQARWMILRDAFIEQEGLSVTDEEMDAYFEKAAGDDEQLSASVLRQYYQSMNLMDRVQQRMLTDKVYEALSSKFTLNELDRAAFEAELTARAERQEAAAKDEPAEHAAAEEAE